MKDRTSSRSSSMSAMLSAAAFGRVNNAFTKTICVLSSELQVKAHVVLGLQSSYVLALEQDPFLQVRQNAVHGVCTRKEHS